jgi:hypothetical protein
VQLYNTHIILTYLSVEVEGNDVSFTGIHGEVGERVACGDLWR